MIDLIMTLLAQKTFFIDFIDHKNYVALYTMLFYLPILLQLINCLVDLAATSGTFQRQLIRLLETTSTFIWFTQTP